VSNVDCLFYFLIFVVQVKSWIITPKLCKESEDFFFDVLRIVTSAMREGVFVTTLVHRGVVPSLFRGGVSVGIGRNAVEALPASLSQSVAI
jgi:hypothetical protein